MIAYLLFSGKVAMYLHPKMNGYLWFSLIVLILINVQWIATLLGGDVKKRPLPIGILLFFLPIILFLTGPSQMSNAVIQNKSIGVNLPNAEALNEIPDVPTDELLEEPLDKQLEEIIVEQDKQQLEEPMDKQLEEQLEEASDEQLEEQAEAQLDVSTTNAEPITSNDDMISTPKNPIYIEDFYKFIVNTFESPAIYENKEVTIEGFVFRDEGFGLDNSKFILSRLVMSCCAADSYVMGPFVSYDGDVDFIDGEWYQITGTMEMDVIKNIYTDKYETYLMLKPNEITSIPAYENPYIYPYEIEQ